MKRHLKNSMSGVTLVSGKQMKRGYIACKARTSGKIFASPGLPLNCNRVTMSAKLQEATGRWATRISYPAIFVLKFTQWIELIRFESKTHVVLIATDNYTQRYYDFSTNIYVIF